MLFGSVSQYIVRPRACARPSRRSSWRGRARSSAARLSRRGRVATLSSASRAAPPPATRARRLAMVPVGRSRARPPRRPGGLAGGAAGACQRRAMAAPRTAATASGVGDLRRLCRAGRLRRRRRPGSADPTQLAIRAAVSVPTASAPRFAVVLDLPVDESTVARMRDETGIELRDISAADRRGPGAAPAPAGRVAARPAAAFGAADRRLRRWVAMLELARTGRPADRARQRPAVARHRRDLQPAVAGRARRRDEQRLLIMLVGVGSAVPVHPVRRADLRPRAGAVDHRVDPRAVCRHRAGPERRLLAQDRGARRATSWASWPTRSTR